MVLCSSQTSTHQLRHTTVAIPPVLHKTIGLSPQPDAGQQRWRGKGKLGGALLPGPGGAVADREKEKPLRAGWNKPAVTAGLLWPRSRLSGRHPSNLAQLHERGKGVDTTRPCAKPRCHSVPSILSRNTPHSTVGYPALSPLQPLPPSLPRSPSHVIHVTARQQLLQSSSVFPSTGQTGQPE